MVRLDPVGRLIASRSAALSVMLAVSVIV